MFRGREDPPRNPTTVPQIVATEVALGSKKTADGADFYKINAKGNVPTIVLEDGTVLNENVATLQYIADQAPASGLAPAWGTSARYQLVNVLAFLSSEVHGACAHAGGLDPHHAVALRDPRCANPPSTQPLHRAANFGPLFNPKISPEIKAAQHEKLKAKFDILVNQVLKDKPFLTGDHFTVADSCA